MRPTAALVMTCALLMASSALPEEEEKPPAPKMVEIDTGKGAKVAAEVSEPVRGGETKPAVVLLHGEGADRSMWKPLVEKLVQCDMSVVALELKPQSADGAAAPTWTGCVDEALAAVRWTRGTLLANGKKVVLVGCGAGGNVAVAAARRDPGVAAALVLGPLPGAGGVEAGLTQWDARPIALVAGAKSSRLGELRKMAAPLVKQPRAETLLVDGAGGHGADLLAASPDAALEVAQWIYGWIDRPSFDAKASNVKESSGPGHIVASQSTVGSGMGGGGGIRVYAQRAPQDIDGMGVLVDPDPKAKSLSERTRRLTLTPGKAKGVVTVKIERSSGKSWKSEGTVELVDCGGFGKDANVDVCSIWLSPRVLGVKPFTDIAIKACFVDKGKFALEDEKPFGGTDLGHFGDAGGKMPERKLFKMTDPSTWEHYSLR